MTGQARAGMNSFLFINDAVIDLILIGYGYVMNLLALDEPVLFLLRVLFHIL
jgi:hypothetical protein